MNLIEKVEIPVVLAYAVVFAMLVMAYLLMKSVSVIIERIRYLEYTDCLLECEIEKKQY